MLLFVGKKEKGFFTEETKEKVEYIDEALHIKDQAEAILRFNEEATVVFMILNNMRTKQRNWFTGLIGLKML